MSTGVERAPEFSPEISVDLTPQEMYEKLHTQYPDKLVDFRDSTQNIPDLSAGTILDDWPRKDMIISYYQDYLNAPIIIDSFNEDHFARRAWREEEFEKNPEAKEFIRSNKLRKGVFSYLINAQDVLFNYVKQRVVGAKSVNPESPEARFWELKYDQLLKYKLSNMRGYDSLPTTEAELSLREARGNPVEVTEELPYKTKLEAVKAIEEKVIGILKTIAKDRIKYTAAGEA